MWAGGALGRQSEAGLRTSTPAYPVRRRHSGTPLIATDVAIAAVVRRPVPGGASQDPANGKPHRLFVSGGSARLGVARPQLLRFLKSTFASWLPDWRPAEATRRRRCSSSRRTVQMPNRSSASGVVRLARDLESQLRSGSIWCDPATGSFSTISYVHGRTQTASGIQ